MPNASDSLPSMSMLAEVHLAQPQARTTHVFSEFGVNDLEGGSLLRHVLDLRRMKKRKETAQREVNNCGEVGRSQKMPPSSMQLRLEQLNLKDGAAELRLDWRMGSSRRPSTRPDPLLFSFCSGTRYDTQLQFSG